jgi:drug/metabolite transporter superfamily protein YnfA
MKAQLATALILLTSLAQGTTPNGLGKSDWSSIRAAYEGGRHQFFAQEDGTHLASNPGLGWKMTFDEKGFTATPQDGAWTWGLELVSVADTAVFMDAGVAASHGGNTLAIQRAPHLTEWFINDQRGLEQGWTLTVPAEIRLRVRGNLKASIAPQSITFGDQLTYAGLKAWDANGKTVPTHFEPTAEGFAVRYDDSGAQYPITIDPLAQSAYVKASNADVEDYFGTDVAVSGDTVVIGANRESSSTTGVNGNQADNSAMGAGAAYVFVRNGGTWTQQAYLKASNTGAEDLFGSSVAISGDTIVVGAEWEDSSSTGVNSTPNDNEEDAGAAYVFTRTGNVWTQQAYLKAQQTTKANGNPFDNFGGSVAISGDTIIVGSRGESSSTTGVNSTPNEAAAGAGAAYIFKRTGSKWAQQAYLKASNVGVSDKFGFSVAISGNTAVVGATGEGSSTTGVNTTPNDLVPDSGAAYVFTRSGSTWSQQAFIKASTADTFDYFGNAVAISGDTLVVGAQGEASSSTGVNSIPNNLAELAGAAYVFARSGSTWTQQAYLKASNTGTYDWFGFDVGISGDVIAVGAPYEQSSTAGINSAPDNALNAAGATYLFFRYGSTWAQAAFLKASNPGNDDWFGNAVAVSGDTVIVGAWNENSSTTGIDSTPNDTANNAGAAYFFNIGDVLTSLSKSGTSAVGGADLAFGSSGYGALSPDGQSLFESSLTGNASTSGRNRAMFSTVSGTVDIALQNGTVVSGIAGLPFGSKITAVTSPIHNRTSSIGIFQGTVSGSGLNATNNRVLFKDNGAFISPITRTGLPVVALGGAIPSTFREVLQREGGNDQIALNYTLKSGVASVTPANDSGLLLMSHAGTVTHFAAREGETAFGGGGKFGSFGRAAVTNTGFVSFIAKFTPTGGKPLDALFYTGSSSARNTPLQGSTAGSTTYPFGVFTGLTRIASSGLLRATLTGSPTTSNEGVWRESNTLLLRKGQFLGSGLTVSRIVRVWGINSVQVVAQVVLGGSGVNSSNNQALILRQFDNNFLVLMRTGQPAPGIGLSKVTVGSFQAIDVDPVNGHYTVLGSLKGAATSANQALWSGNTNLGSDTTLQYLRLPRLRVQKGEPYATDATPGDIVRGIGLKPAVDASGVGGRGFGQVINDDGEILLTLTGDRKVQETVRLTP